MSPITLITSPPPSISPAEHRQLVASTPVSFSDIPPVLHHKEERVSASFEPALDGFSTEDSSKGTLYVTESVLAFISDSGKGFQIDYPTITLHAVSRGSASPSIYCQLDETSLNQEDGEPSSEEVPDVRELTLAPENSASLEPIFEALSLCAALHPDPQGSDDEMDDAFVDAAEGNFETFTGDEAQELTEVGRASLAYLESIIDDSHGRSPPPEEDKTHSEGPSPKINGTS